MPPPKRKRKQGKGLELSFYHSKSTSYANPLYPLSIFLLLYNPVLWFERAEDGRIFQTLQCLSLVYTPTLPRARCIKCGQRACIQTHFVVLA